MESDEPNALDQRIAEWEAPVGDEAPDAASALTVDVAGFEGPLDLLLALARTQKVDVSRISVVALADQYLAYIDQVAELRLEVAADYLVMAAWLTFLKSRLLLPREKTADGGPSGEELAARFAFRLMRLDAMRKAAAQLLTRKRLGRDVFARGMPEGTRQVRETAYTAEIYDLLKAYADQRQRTVKHVHVVRQRTVWSIKDARRRLERLIGESTGGWFQLDLLLDAVRPSAEVSATVLASSFGASLELAREGMLELRQDAPFAPIHMRRVGAGDLRLVK